MSLVCFWAGLQFCYVLQIPSKELIVYHEKKSQLFDFSTSGVVFSWNQGLEPEEISYSVDPNRVQKIGLRFRSR